jgi:ribose-phosphate pyrophosphokinase
MDKLKLITGTSNIEFAESVVKELGVGVELFQVASRYSDGEIKVELPGDIRGADVFIVQSTQPPAENILELLIMIDAAKRASAGRITAVIPYFGYGRQERKDKPRKPISAKLIADCIEASGANRVLTVDLHAGAIPGFFKIPVDHLQGGDIIFRYALKYLKEQGVNIKEELVMVAPDAGALVTTRALAKKINCSRVVFIDKRRPTDNVSEVVNVVGIDYFEGVKKVALFVDDLIDTAGTLTTGADAVVKVGAKAVYGAITHPVLSGPAIQRLANSSIQKLFIGDTIPVSGEKIIDKLELVSLARLVGSAIYFIHNEESVSQLFNQPIDLEKL